MLEGRNEITDTEAGVCRLFNLGQCVWNGDFKRPL